MQRRFPLALLVAPALALALPLAACSAAPPEEDTSAESDELAGNPRAKVDLDVTYVRRTPELAYPDAPHAGDAVQWIAEVRNRGVVATGSFDFRWSVDGAVVLEGSAPSIPVGGASDLTLPWSWQDGPHDIRIAVDPHGKKKQLSKKNDVRTVRSDALMVGLWVERSVRDWFDAHRYEFQRAHHLGDEANSWEDWAELQMNEWNKMLASAVYPSAPQGGLDRVRLQKVVVVDDGKLPLNGGLKTNDPDMKDRTVDMEWGFPAPVDTKFYDLADPKGHLVLEPSLIHEMNHARFLVDSYGLDVDGDQISVTGSDGKRIFAPGHEIAHKASTGPSLMRTTSTTYAEWEIDWLNAYAKERQHASWGNFNASNAMSEYMRLKPAMPRDNVLRFVDANGAPAAGAEVYVYHAKDAPGLYGKVLEGGPDVTGTTDADGRFALGGQPFGVQFPNSETFGHFWRGVDFVRVVHGGVEHHTWLDLAEVNVAWFRGEAATAVYERRLVKELIPNWLPCTEDVACTSKICGCNGGTRRVCLPHGYNRSCT